MKTAKYILAGIVAFVALGLIGHQDFKDQQLQHASDTCHYQTTQTIPTFQQCIDNQLERNSDK